MNLQQLIKHLRIYILDDSGGHGIDWTTINEGDPEEVMLRWSNEELTQYINEAEREVARRTLCIQDATTPEVCRINVVADTALYNLHEKILKVKRAKLASQKFPLKKKSIYDYFEISDWDTQTGTPGYWIEDYQRHKIRFDKIPEANDTLNLSVYRYPLYDMCWASDTQDEPEIDEVYQIKMLDYAAYLAYGKDDPNTFDSNRAQFRLARFVNEFGEASAYSEVRKKRTSHRGVQYGGIR